MVAHVARAGTMGAACQVAPRSAERRTAPGFGSQLLVYIPAATYTRFGSTGSLARLTTPLCPQSAQPTESSSGSQRPAAGFHRYAPPMSVRA